MSDRLHRALRRASFDRVDSPWALGDHVAADAVCWRRADRDALLECVADVAEFPQLLVRALVYRMVTDVSAPGARLDGFAPGLDLAARLIDG